MGTTIPHPTFLCPVCEQEKDTTELYNPTNAKFRFILCNACATIGRYCPTCETYKLFAEFGKDSHRPNGVRTYCKPCDCARHKGIHNPVKLRAHKLKVRFNLTQGQYDKMFLVQGGVCAICKKPETRMDNTGERVRALAVDHDHKTGIVRQLLCGSCNYIIGCAKDDADLLQSASEYLRRNSI